MVEGMRGHGKELNGRLGGRDGFVIPATIFALLMMSTLAVAAILTSGDARRSSRAIRESNAALYAAEAGLNEVWATWDDTLIAGLIPGDSLDFGWRNLGAGGGSYRVVLHRMDNGGQKIFALVSEGRGAGPLGGQRMISLSLSASTAKICCDGSVVGGGTVPAGISEARLDSANLGAAASGRDTVPTGWDDGTVCGNGLQDIPGIVWGDTTPGTVDLDNNAFVEGNPRMVQDTSLNDATLFEWGAFNYDSLAARADLTLPPDILDDATIGPVESPPGTCDVSVTSNWGAPTDPSSACFDYFPIIHVTGDLRIQGATPGVGQGILMVDGELRIEDSFDFYGIVIARGEMRIEDNVNIFGGAIAGERLRVENGAGIRYSQCAANRAMLANELTVTKVLSSRSWGEVLR